MNVWLIISISLILAVVSAYMFVIEAFSVAFKLTGLATKKIGLQVASLFTSTGFTTSESELITNDDRRRKIATACIYTGHLFSVLIMGLVINGLVRLSDSSSWSTDQVSFTEWYFIMLYVSAGLFLIVLFIKIPPVNRRFQKFLEAIAISASKRGRNTNIITVIDYYGKHALVEVILNKIPAFASESTLLQMELTKKYSINILSIKRGKRIIEATKDTMFRKGDVLIMYGLISEIQNAFINSLDQSNKTIVVDKSNELVLINNYGSNALMEIDVVEVPKELENVKMKDSQLTDRYSINIVVIKRKEEYIFADKDTIIQAGDRITLLGPYNNIKHLFNNDDK